MRTTKSFRLLACLLILAAHGFVAAEDVYYLVPVSLKFMGAALTGAAQRDAQDYWFSRRWLLEPAVQPYAVLDGAGEVYVGRVDQASGEPTAILSIRAAQAAEVTGRLFVPQASPGGQVQFRFKATPTEARPEAKETFFKAKGRHYRQLQERNLPGAAWFRHQAEATDAPGGQIRSPAAALPNARRQQQSELENTYDLFSGGRALSENLQLDRVLPTTKTAEETVAITNLAGITVKEMNWKALIQNAKPGLDPLAAFIPADQHAIFFPSFQAMVQMVDEADANGTPVLQLLEPRSEDANARTRYQKQLALGLSEVSRLLGPSVVASVAFTGSDPFLRVGTDVAVLFEARNPDLLKTFLAVQHKAAQTANPGAKAVQGDIAGVAYTGVVAGDRSVSSYLAGVSNVVMVSNSRIQLENLIRVAKGGAPPLSSQDEYVFFRSRYSRMEKSETAFVVLTDATIRRWCGPKWRIADSRRTRAGAVLAELQAAQLDALASGQAAEAALATDFDLPGAGELRLTRTGVASSTYGSLNFMTPIAEMSLDQVTRAEADAYQRWRDSYQRNWRQYFDPIAIRFSIAPNRLGAEMTVTPLIAATDYRHFIDLASGAQIAPGAGDPHTNTLLHLVLAVNTQSKPVQDVGNFFGNSAPGLKTNPLGWLGQSVALYADEDPFWESLRQATNASTFMEANFTSLPLALHCEVKNPLGLAAFLTAFHAFVDQSAPRLTTWENLDYQNQPYVKITARTGEGRPGARDVAIYYAATLRSLIVTLNEPLLKRALDRQAARSSAGNQEKPAADNPWLGKSFCVAAAPRFIDVLQAFTQDPYQTRLQLLAWNNLPILNEWKRRYPDKDPVKVHEQLWGAKLLCPGGGSYVWNEKWQTMESTVLGHPGEPKTSSNQALSQVLAAQFGITFEYQGLSARALLNRRPNDAPVKPR